MPEVENVPAKRIEFCQKFQKEYLQVVHDCADRLETISSSASVTLGDTEFSTKSTEQITAIAQKLLNAVSEGEIRIRELQRKAEEDERLLEPFER